MSQKILQLLKGGTPVRLPLDWQTCASFVKQSLCPDKKLRVLAARAIYRSAEVLRGDTFGGHFAEPPPAVALQNRPG